MLVKFLGMNLSKWLALFSLLLCLAEAAKIVKTSRKSKRSPLIKIPRGSEDKKSHEATLKQSHLATSKASSVIPKANSVTTAKSRIGTAKITGKFKPLKNIAPPTSSDSESESESTIKTNDMENYVNVFLSIAIVLVILAACLVSYLAYRIYRLYDDPNDSFE